MKNLTDLIGKHAASAPEENSVLRREVERIVNPEIMKNVLFIREEGQRLRITVNSSAWASRMRFYSESIIQSLARAGIELRGVSFHVQPQENMSYKQRKSEGKPIAASAASIRHVAQVAEGIEDESLRKSMLKLAAALRTRSAD